MELPKECRPKLCIKNKDLDVNSNLIIQFFKIPNWIVEYRVHVNYDGLTWIYTFMDAVPFGADTVLELRWTDFSRKGYIYCLLAFILDKDTIDFLIKY